MFEKHKVCSLSTINPDVEREVEDCSSLLSSEYSLRDPTKMYCLKD
jgi:hypothetical protein